jgi:hypothetical protein
MKETYKEGHKLADEGAKIAVKKTTKTEVKQVSSRYSKKIESKKFEPIINNKRKGRGA